MLLDLGHEPIEQKTLQPGYDKLDHLGAGKFQRLSGGWRRGADSVQPEHSAALRPAHEEPRSADPDPLLEGRRRIMRRDEEQDVIFPVEDISELGVADAGRLFQHGCEHWLKIAGRTANRLEHGRI